MSESVARAPASESALFMACRNFVRYCTAHNGIFFFAGGESNLENIHRKEAAVSHKHSISIPGLMTTSVADILTTNKYTILHP